MPHTRRQSMPLGSFASSSTMQRRLRLHPARDADRRRLSSSGLCSTRHWQSKPSNQHPTRLITLFVFWCGSGQSNARSIGKRGRKGALREHCCKPTARLAMLGRSRCQVWRFMKHVSNPCVNSIFGIFFLLLVTCRRKSLADLAATAS